MGPRGDEAEERLQPGRLARNGSSPAADGRPLWQTASGELREVYRAADGFDADPPPETCACGHDAFVRTVVREHRPCGYVAFDGFVDLEERRTFQCPKCAAVAADSTQFDIVSLIWTCRRCGRPSDQSVTTGRRP